MHRPSGKPAAESVRPCREIPWPSVAGRAALPRDGEQQRDAASDGRYERRRGASILPTRSRRYADRARIARPIELLLPRHPCLESSRHYCRESEATAQKLPTAALLRRLPPPLRFRSRLKLAHCESRRAAMRDSRRLLSALQLACNFVSSLHDDIHDAKGGVRSDGCSSKSVDPS